MKSQNQSAQLKKIPLEGELILDEAMLEMPIHRTKQLQDLIKLKIEEQRIIQQFNTKALSLKQSKQSKQSYSKKLLPTKPIQKASTIALQQQSPTNKSNSSYIVNCVIRALKYRKLAIDDVADIFGIESQVVEEIDKYRRLNQIEGNGDPALSGKNPKIDLQKKVLMKELEMKFKNAAYEKVVENSFTKNNLNKSTVSSSSFVSNYRPQTLSNTELSSILESQQKEQQEESLFEYQKLLKRPPPHKIDDKVKAIVEILKKHPNIMQKDAVKILADQYGIKNMSQTSISRYYKKIYEMRRCVGVLLSAKRQGFIDI